MINNHIIIIRNAKSYDFGGGERFPVFLASELTKLDYEPLIISRSPKLLAFANDQKIKTTHGWWWSWQNWSGKFALLFPIYIIWQIVLTTWYLVEFIKNKPDIIHIQSKDDFVAATFAGRLLNKRIIWTDHADLKHIWKNINIWYKNPVGKLVHFAAKFTHKITVVSKSEYSFVCNNLKDKDPIKNKINIIYNGVIDTTAKYKETLRDNFIFCCVSRLVTDKGIGEMISAFIKLSKDYDSLKLVIVGDGPEEEKFKQQAIGHKNIEFLGYQKDPLSYVKNSDIYLQPTYHEGFSVSLVEASMLEKPIIATSVGGNVEIIKDQKTGLLIPAKDINNLYDTMKLLYSNPALREKLAKNARNQYEEKFQFDQIVKNNFIPLYAGDKI